jgi:hypothetical protein
VKNFTFREQWQIKSNYVSRRELLLFHAQKQAGDSIGDGHRELGHRATAGEVGEGNPVGLGQICVLLDGVIQTAKGLEKELKFLIGNLV